MVAGWPAIRSIERVNSEPHSSSGAKSSFAAAGQVVPAFNTNVAVRVAPGAIVRSVTSIEVTFTREAPKIGCAANKNPKPLYARADEAATSLYEPPGIPVN